MCQTPPVKLHFCTPAVARLAASATFPLTAEVTNVPSPSSQAYNVFASANQIPKGNATGAGLPFWSTPLASDVGNPGRIVIGAAASCAVVPVGSAPALPT